MPNSSFAPELVVIDVRAGAAMESQSGLQMSRPRIYGAFSRVPNGRTAAIVMHPTSNFMGHYLLQPLSQRGISVLALNSRYVGNDCLLIMERVIQDMGAGVRWLREQGYERVVLIGNSGGGSLASFYQSQAENLTVTCTPAGDAINLKSEDLPPADAVVLAAAHPGRSKLLCSWLDASVIDEKDPSSANPALDIFDSRHSRPFSAEFLALVRKFQDQRWRSLEDRVRARLEFLRKDPTGPQDEAFIVYRTFADPRCLDPSIDPNDRTPGTSIWGDPRQVNYAANSMGRYTSLSAFMSQWAPASQADGPTNLERTSVPVLLLEYTADASVFPSDVAAYALATRNRVEHVAVRGATHYLLGQPEKIVTVAEHITAWVTS